MDPLSRRTARLYIRPLAESDRAEYLRMEAVSAEHSTPWLPTPDPALTPGERFTRALESSLREEKAGAGLRRVGVLDDGRIATVVALSQIFRGPFLSCYAGWRTSSEVLGKGLCTESMHALLDIAFAGLPGGLGLHRVQANIIPTNAASLRVAEKLGLRREGYAPRYLKIDGRWQDHAMFAILADEFERPRMNAAIRPCAPDPPAAARSPLPRASRSHPSRAPRSATN